MFQRSGYHRSGAMEKTVCGNRYGQLQRKYFSGQLHTTSGKTASGFFLFTLQSYLLLAAVLFSIILSNSAFAATTVGTITVTPTNEGIWISAAYTDGGSNTLKISWKPSSLTVWQETLLSHSDSPYEYKISGLSNGTAYDVKVEFLDDLVNGTNPQDFRVVPSLLMHNSDNATLRNLAENLKWSSEGGWGIPGGKYGQFVCETCHQRSAPNIKRVKGTITPPSEVIPGDGSVVSFQSMSDFGDDSDSARKICEVCHSQTRYHRFDPAPQYDKSHYNEQTCTLKCHKHKGGFGHGTGGGKVEECIECHGHDKDYEYESGKYSLGKGTADVHSTHTDNDSDDARGPRPNLDCSACHDTEYMPFFKSGTPQDGDGKYNLAETDVCDDCHSPGGTYNGIRNYKGSVGAKDNWHTGGVYSTDGSLLPGKSKWCAGCHDESPSKIPPVTGISAPNVIGDEDASFTYGTGYGFYKTGHGVPDTDTYPASGGATAGAGKGCLDCHDSTGAHIDGSSRTFDCTSGTGGACTNAYKTGYRLQEVDGNAPMQIPQTGRNLESYRLCLNCHTNTDDWLSSTESTRIETNFYEGSQNYHIYHLKYSQASELDWDGTKEGSMSCITCHNVHGSQNPAMVRSGELTGFASIIVRYGNNETTQGSSDIEPVPNNVTLLNSTKISMRGDQADPYCSNCHGGSSNLVTLVRNPEGIQPQAPVLKWVGIPGYEADGVNPDAGQSGDSFTFRVEYSDLNQDAPTVIQVWIDLNGNDMYDNDGLEKITLDQAFAQLDSVAPYSYGVDYFKTVTINKTTAAGNSVKYRFYAEANAQPSGTDVATGEATNESTLNILNSAPTLEWSGDAGYMDDGVNPDYGLQGDNYVFKVKYIDEDDACPASGSPNIQVGIDLNHDGLYDGEKFNLAEVDGLDADCTASGGGKLYSLTKNDLTTSGTYSYRFFAFDGIDNATGAPTSDHIVTVGTNHPPLLSWNTGTCRPEGAYPPKSATSSTINFSVIYYDEDNQCPTGGIAGDIQVYFDGQQTNLGPVDGDADCTSAGGGKVYSVTVTPTTVASGMTYTFYATDGTDSALGDPVTTGGTVDVISATKVVKQDGTEDYTTISAAISGTGSGATILVYDGTYNENLAMNNVGSRTIASACGAPDTVISSTNNPVVLLNTTWGTLLDGFTVTGSTTGVGIRVTGTHYDAHTSYPTIKDSIIRNNGGRGISSDDKSNVTVTGCEIYENAGGGVLDARAISDTVIRNNSVTGNGGGISSGSATLTNVTIKDNTATGSGGGIYCSRTGGGSFAHEKVVLSRNTGASGGGGYFYLCSPTFTNSLVSDNTATTGGGVYFNNASIVFRNSTIVNNTATGDGGAYYSVFGPVDLSNSIAWGNRAGGEGHIGKFTATSGTASTADLYDSIIENNGDDNITDDNYFIETTINNVVDRGSNHDAAPNFVDATNADKTKRDYHIIPPSMNIDHAAANAIQSTLPADDLDGNSRTSGDEDMGAYEYQGQTGDYAPVLAWTGQTGYESDGVNPDYDAGGANFEFRVDYRHDGNVAPNPIQLWVDMNSNGAYESDAGEKIDMDKIVIGDNYDDGNYVNIERYTKTLALYKNGGGEINYRFYASDGQDVSTDEPTTLHTVYVDNMGPTLAWPGDNADYLTDGVDPNSGPAGSTFTFRVLYTDVDNISNTSPSTKQIWIDKNDNGVYGADEKFDMTAESGSGAYHDGNYMNGELFTSSAIPIDYAGDGRLLYRFYFVDGTDAATGSPTNIDDIDERNSRFVEVSYYNTTVGTATATASDTADTEINISMPYTNDGNADNTYTIRYCVSSGCVWSAPQNYEHSASPFTTIITGLTSGQTYNIEMTYNDPDGVTGTNPVIQYNITLKEFATTAGTASAIASSSTTIDVSMPYTYDDNHNNTYRVEYCTPSPCGGNWIVFGDDPHGHTASPFQTSITGLTTGSTYDVRMTYNDNVDGVSGAAVQTVTGILLSSNAPPVGGYVADNVIPAAQITQSSSGIITIRWKGTDAETETVTLNTFQYSTDGGSTWNAPANGDSSASLSSGWTDNTGARYTTAATFAAAPEYSFTFNTKHPDVSGLDGVDQSDVRIRFKLNDGTYNSMSPATSESFRVDNEGPTASICSAVYDASADTMTISGADFTTIATAGTDIKSYVDWTKFVWDINGDGATTTNITFAEGDVTSFTVTSDLKLTVVFTATKGTAIEATTGYGSAGGLDKLDVTAGFLKDIYNNASTTDSIENGALSTGPKVFHVTKTDDTKDGACDSDCSLREAVDAVNGRTGGDIIYAPAGTYTITRTGALDNTNTNGDFDISQTVEIVGGCNGSTIIAGDSGDRVFEEVASANVTFTGLTIRNGNTTGGGGCVYAGGATVTINNSTFENCSATSSGGAVYAAGTSTVYINDSTFTNNTVTAGSGGAVNVVGAAYVSGSAFTSNTAYNSGGGIYSTAASTISNSTFTGNVAQNGTNVSGLYYSGGAIYTTANLTVGSSIFTGNHGFAIGGAIFNRNGTSCCTTTVTDSVFDGNYTHSTTTAESFAGAIMSRSGINATRTTFKNNYVGYTGGAAASGRGGAMFTSGTAKLVQCTVSNNYAPSDGGAIWAESIAFYNSTISNNAVTVTGIAAVFRNAGTCAIQNTTFYGNSAKATADSLSAGSCTIVNAVFDNSTTDADGVPNNCSDAYTGTTYTVENRATCGTTGTGYLSNTASGLDSTLADNGGPTKTHALQSGSAAIDSGDNATCANANINNIDQRGATRPVNGTCDRGAFEFGATAP